MVEIWLIGTAVFAAAVLIAYVFVLAYEPKTLLGEAFDLDDDFEDFTMFSALMFFIGSWLWPVLGVIVLPTIVVGKRLKARHEATK